MPLACQSQQLGPQEVLRSGQLTHLRMKAMGVAMLSSTSSVAAHAKIVLHAPAQPLKPAGREVNSFQNVHGAMARIKLVYMQIWARRGSRLWHLW